MNEEPLFDAKAPVLDTRRREWVSLDSGRLCVWELEAADKLFILEQSVRPAPEGRQRVSSGDAMLWQIMVSCYKGDHPGAERIFEITDMPRIQRLRGSEWDKLLAAIERVNGLDPEEVRLLQDFTPPGPAGKSRK